MFGALRFLLAMMVVANHILHIGHIGQFAVFGFYSLSGYLMTYVVLNSYGFDSKGFCKFWANRSLRLFPSYWFSISISILLIFCVSEEYVSSFNGSMQLPKTPGDWFSNIFIAFLALNPAEVTPRLSGPTWAITVELFFYFAISLGLSKSIHRVLIWLLISLAYHILSLLLGWGYESRYFPLTAASLPFAAGAMIYHIKDKESTIASLITRHHSLLLVTYLASIFAYLFTHHIAKNNNMSLPINVSVTIEFYLSFLLLWCYIFSCAKSEKGFPFLSQKLDSMLGSFSYPVYLLHYQAWIIGSFICLNQPGKATLPTTVIILLMLCGITVILIEKPIEKLRQLVKNNKHSHYRIQ